MTMMTAGRRAHLRNLCAIFEIPVSATDPDPELAWFVLSNIYLVPTIEAQTERRRALNGLMAPLRESFDDHSPFVGRLGFVAIAMQEFPHWFPDLSTSTETLVQQHVWLWRAQIALGAVALGTTAKGAPSAGVAEWIKTRSARQGLAKAAGRAMGRGELAEAVMTRMSPATAARANPWILGASAAATAAVFAANERLGEIRAMLMHRYQSGDMTDEQYARVFGDTPHPESVGRYWEL